MGLFVSVLALYSVVTHKPLTADDFELVVASPVSVSVLDDSTKAPFADIRLPDDPLRYRIAVERFQELDDPSAFLQAASRPGAVLHFRVDRGARQHPNTPRLDAKPTVFVESIAVGDTEFYPISKRIEWDHKNQLYARIIAGLFPLLTVFLGRALWLKRRKQTS